VSPADVLAFERQWWIQAGNKERAIRDRFGVTPTRYYQRLRDVVLDPESLPIDPATVRRLQRIMRRH
jgi:hypothetical protein